MTIAEFKEKGILPFIKDEKGYEVLDRKYLTEEDQRQNKKFYDVVAKRYANERAWTVGTEKAIQVNLLSRVLRYVKPGERVLVVGTGTGKDQDLLQKSGVEVFGADLSWPMLREAANRIEDKFAQAEAVALPFSERFVDFLYAEAVAEHMDRDDLNRFLIQAKRVIKPNSERKAHLLLNVRNGKGNVIRVRDMGMDKFFATYELEGLNDIFTANNMEIVEQWQAWGGTPKVEDSLPWLDTIVRIRFDKK